MTSTERAMERLKNDLVAERRRRFLERFERKMLEAGFDRDYAQLQARMAMEQTKLSDDLTPYIEDDEDRHAGDEAADVLADAAIATAPEKWRIGQPKAPYAGDYDPVTAGKAMAAEQAKQREINKLAFE